MFRHDKESVSIWLCDLQCQCTNHQHNDNLMKLHSMLNGKLCFSNNKVLLTPFSKQFNHVKTISFTGSVESSGVFYQDVKIVYRYELIIITLGSDLILLDYNSKQYLKSIPIESGSIASIEVDRVEEFLYVLIINSLIGKISLQKHDLKQLIKGEESIIWRNDSGFSFGDDNHVLERKIALKEVNSKQFVYIMYYEDGLHIFNGSDGKLDQTISHLLYNTFMKFNEKGEILASGFGGLAKYYLEQDQWMEHEHVSYESVEGIYFEKSSQLTYTIEDSYFIVWYDEKLNVELKKKLDLQNITGITIDERRGEIYIISHDRKLNIYN